MADKTPVRYFPAGEVGPIDQLGEYHPGDTIAWSVVNKAGSSLADLATRSASDLSSGTLPTGRISGAYSGLTGVGTVVSGVWNGTAVDATHGGTAQTAWATGDILYGSGVNTLGRRTIGSSGDVLTVSGGVPTWVAPVTGVTIVGTLNRITLTGSSPTTIDIAATYVGQTSLTTVGTIVTGVWNAGAVTSSSTVTATSNLIGVGLQATGGASIGTSSIPGTGVLRVANSASQGIIQVGGAATGIPQVNYDQNGVVKAYTFFDNATQRLTFTRSGGSGTGISVDSADDTWISGNIVFSTGKSIYAGSIASTNLRLFSDTGTLYLRGGATNGTFIQTSSAAQAWQFRDSDAMMVMPSGIIFPTGQGFYSTDTATAHLRMTASDTQLTLRGGTSGIVLQSSTAATRMTLVDAGDLTLSTNNKAFYGTKAAGGAFEMLRLNANDDMEVFGAAATTGKILKLAHSQTKPTGGYTGIGNDVWLRGGNYIMSESGLTGKSILGYDPTTDAIRIGGDSGAPANIRWGVTVVSVGTTTLITLGKTGGAGPATAAQNSWLKVMLNDNSQAFIPIWK
jgi:hypothetical protein